MNNQKQFYELLIGCPCSKPTKTCVIEIYRNMSLLELIYTSNLKTCGQTDVLFLKHIECLKCRMGQKAAS